MSQVLKNLPTSSVEKKILQIITKDGERTYYALWKKDKVAASNKTVQVALKKLVEKGLITPKKKTQGTEKKPYILTLQGLIATILQLKNWGSIDLIAEKQERLFPLIFGKWKHFKKNGLEVGELHARLHSLCFIGWQVAHEMRADQLHGWLMENFAGSIMRYTEPEERIKWLKAIHSDSELKEWILKEEYYYRVQTNMWSLSFSLIRKPNPEWDKALVEFQNMLGRARLRAFDEDVKKKE